MIYNKPIYGFLRTLLLFISGKVRFYKEDVGKSIEMADGKKYTIFRRVRILHNQGDSYIPEALFIVRFTPVMDVEKNIKFSRFALLVFMGFKGFRSKYWCVDRQTGECQGVYAWDKLADAQRYSTSVAVSNMTRRSVPGSVNFQVLDNIEANRNWKISGP